MTTKPTAPRSPYQRRIQRELAAECGNYELILQQLGNLAIRDSTSDMLTRLRQAIRVRMSKDPEEFTTSVLNSLFGFGAELVLHFQAILCHDVQALNQRTLEQPGGVDRGKLSSELLPAFQEAARQLAELALIKSQVERQQALTERIRLNNLQLRSGLPEEQNLKPHARVAKELAEKSDISHVPLWPPLPKGEQDWSLDDDDEEPCEFSKKIKEAATCRAK